MSDHVKTLEAWVSIQQEIREMDGGAVHSLETAIRALLVENERLKSDQEIKYVKLAKHEARIDAALALHQPVKNLGGQVYCGCCRDKASPCPTDRILRGKP